MRTLESVESQCRHPLVWFLALAFFPDSCRQPYVYHFFIFVVVVLLFIFSFLFLCGVGSGDRSKAFPL